MRSALLLLLPILAAPMAPPRPALDIEPSQVRFGRQPFGSFTVKNFTITNRSGAPVLVSIETTDVGDDFSPGQPESTCTLTDTALLAAGASCTHVVGFEPSTPFQGRQVATLTVTARDDQGAIVDTQTVKLSGRGF